MSEISYSALLLLTDNVWVLHTKCQRLEGYAGYETEKQPEGREEPAGSDHPTSLFPAFRGDRQAPWEEPRIISKLDFSVHGYNYFEDLLRMAGNSVVEQQAELAFRTLIEKFL